ncbi:GNAT family N-acetyltransferase [Candidatus Poriferisocius sp.]|uniref:GNAT family N-acetyltransferase n=1 Tax=Candidatus Poriferisocius sp. TaxID=3101276 RepID=UPI003B5BAE4C
MGERPAEAPKGGDRRRGVEATARPARPDDVAGVAELAREARQEALEYRGGQRWIATEAASEPLEDHFGAQLADPQAMVMVGVWDTAVVGYGWARRQVRVDGAAIARIEELFVSPEARSVGVGESLFDALTRWAVDQGAVAMDAVVLPGHREAKNFFETFKMTAHALIMHTPIGEGERP